MVKQANKSAAQPAPKTVDVARRLTATRQEPTAPKPHRCLATTRAGKKCKAVPLVGRPVCLMHSDPDIPSKLGGRGGRRRTVYRPDGLMEFPAPTNAADLCLLLAQTIVEVRNGKIETKAATALAYLGAGFLKAFEVSNLATRIKALEDRTAARSDTWGTANL